MDVRTTEFAAADAKARFSELLARAEHGEAITIKRHGRAVARLVPVAEDSTTAEAARQKAIDNFANWVKARPVHPGRIDYKALVNEGRR